MSSRFGLPRMLCRACVMILAVGLLLSVSACAKDAKAPRGATAVTTEEQTEVAALDRLAEEAEKLTKEGKIAEARIRLNTLGEKMIATRFHGITGLEGVRSLSDAILSAQRSYNQARFSETRALEALAQIRLITDAMLHSDNPLWHRSYKLMKDGVSRMEAAVAEGDSAGLKGAYQDLKQHYQQIRPAVTVKTPPERMEKLDSVIAYFDRQLTAGQLSGEGGLAALKQLDGSIDELFDRKEDRTAYLPLSRAERPLLWTFGIGTLLTAVLSFVGWRMYHSDKRLVRVNRDQLRKRS
ncbi:sporulation protein YpjB [Gorillibacterium timonense]|uniref:sporulation protein YpjB n=1 Tax=Gorillibacterium timonense TaxID=1689269 RepID=UPI00071C5438|nr:sporulation protein YpjB [Gorillibacterium timonense]